MPAASQLIRWSGEFGDAYTDRNEIDWHDRLPAFTEICAGLEIGSVLEVGCNRGHNLRALQCLLPGSRLAGVEPNDHARALAAATVPGCDLRAAEAGALPFPAASCDLVFTSGVLIHIPPADLDRVLAEIHRVARRWILAIEYFAERDECLPYRGRADMLWKRNFIAHYRDRFPELLKLRQGFLGRDAGFDDCRWWLLQKPEGPAGPGPAGAAGESP
jgi:pseudaminic acid biosynthesis-associated methylase